MTRRALLAFAAASPKKPAPTDADRMNVFANRWNEYVQRLQQGVIDIKLWDHARQAWERIS